MTLQNVYVQESNYFVPVAVSGKTVRMFGFFSYMKISVNMNSQTRKHIANFAKSTRVTEITKEMREGVPPQGFFNKTNGGDSFTFPIWSLVSGAVVLLHGYCSTVNPWEANANDWTNPYFFIVSGASITNDEFAQKVLAVRNMWFCFIF